MTTSDISPFGDGSISALMNLLRLIDKAETGPGFPVGDEKYYDGWEQAVKWARTLTEVLRYGRHAPAAMEAYRIYASFSGGAGRWEGLSKTQQQMWVEIAKAIGGKPEDITPRCDS